VRNEIADKDSVEQLARTIFPRSIRLSLEHIVEGVSTLVYRVRRDDDVFYLRVLPELGASFAPEVRVHALLRERNVKVPEVVYYEYYNEALQRSVMVTTEIRGTHVGRRMLDADVRNILVDVGRELAVINSIPVQGFGWIRRDRSEVVQLEADLPTYRAFVLEHLEDDLTTLGEHLLGCKEVAAIQAIVERCDAWPAVERASLSHGDFDVTHIYQHDGRYSGIIDFGEIRGTDPFYDLGHFALHDGETLPYRVLPYLLEGYGEVAHLPANHEQRIQVSSLLIAIRGLARRVAKYPHDGGSHLHLDSIRRAIAVLSA
jgi:aminoglycoside phosphotransferase (APT) family kinase protein